MEQNSAIQNCFRLQQKKSLELRKWSLNQRKELLRKFSRKILDSEQQILKAFEQDFRKPAVEVLSTEIFPVMAEIQQSLNNLSDWSMTKSIPAGIFFMGSKNQVRPEPKGVVLIIGPWNFPFQLTLVPLVSALAAGNTVILKPSELTPNVSAWIAQAMKEIFPADIVSVFLGGKETSEELLKLPFNHIFFTGSTQVGKIVMQAAAQNLVPVTLELGGKCPVIVDQTANLKQAAEKIIWGKAMNLGQACVAPDHIYAHRSVMAEFTKLCREQIARQTKGPPLAQMITERHLQRQLHMLKEVAPEIQVDAKDRGFAPTLIELKTADSKLEIMKEEIFGPLLPVMPYDDLNALMGELNTQPRPLALYVFSGKNKVCEDVIKTVPSGGVGVNDVVIHVGNVRLPFGGNGASGMGNYHGEAGFRTFSHERAIFRQGWGTHIVRNFYPPYRNFQKQFLRFYIRYLRGM